MAFSHFQLYLCPKRHPAKTVPVSSSCTEAGVPGQARDVTVVVGCSQFPKGHEPQKASEVQVHQPGANTEPPCLGFTTFKWKIKHSTQKHFPVIF